MIVLPLTVSTWPPVPVPAAMLLPAATTTLPLPLFTMMGAVRLPLFWVVMVTLPLPFWLRVLVSVPKPQTDEPSPAKKCPLVAFIVIAPPPLVTEVPRKLIAFLVLSVEVPVTDIPPDAPLISVKLASMPTALPWADVPAKVMPVPDSKCPP